MDDLPGADLVLDGLDALRHGRRTVNALLVSIGATRLRSLGLEVIDPIRDADHELWKALATDDADSAHSRYNALVDRLVSFERALACAN